VSTIKKQDKLFWIYLLSGSIYFTQGIEGLPSMAMFFYLKEHLHYDAATIMYISSITGLAWLVKPLWGYICDNFFTKKLWIVVSLLGSMLISTLFGVLPALPLILLIGLMSISSWNAAVRDVAVDGIMCCDGKEAGNCDKIQAIQWISITIASILVGLAGGYIADHFNYKVAYLSLLPIYLIIVAIVLRYRTSVPKIRTGVHVLETICSYKEYLTKDAFFKYPLVAPIVQLFIYIYNLNPNFYRAIGSYKELFTNKKFLLACLFLFLYKFNPSFGTPLMFIQRDVFHWSGTWMGILGSIISCFEITGAIIFFKFCQTISIKRWLTASVFIGAVSSLCYLYFTPYTAVGYGIMFAVVGMFVHLIVMSFMAQATLPGKEATSFALLCSVSNFAGTLSSISGAYLFPRVGLQMLIILSALTSFMCLPLIKRLGIK
jgi:predicted MFS family arabinose efflux permease